MAPDWPGQGVDKYINAADEWVVVRKVRKRMWVAMLRGGGERSGDVKSLANFAL